MREIRFRAWDMVRETMIKDFTNEAYLLALESFDNVWKNDRYIKMESTGLEYNFHKYFEHDICEMQIPVANGSRKKETIRGYIKFQYGAFFLEEIGEKKRCWIFVEVASMDNSNVKYLGNIHENKELSL